MRQPAKEGGSNDQDSSEHLSNLCQEDELAFECLAGAPDQHLNGSDAYPFVLSNLLVRPVPLLSHREHASMAGRETRQSLVNQLAVYCREDGFLCATHGCGFLTCRNLLATAQGIDAGVIGDHQQPRVELLARETRESLPRSDESLLCYVLGFVAVVKSSDTDPEHRVVVPVV